MLTGTKLYVLIGLGVLVLGGGAYVMYDNANSPDPIEEESQVSEEPASGVGTLASLMGRGESLRCTFSYADEETNTEGVTHVAGERMRGDFVSVVDGEEYESGMYSDGVTMYTWSDSSMGTVGMKYEIQAYDDGMVKVDDGSQSDGEPSQFDLDQEVEYDCQAWSVDESVLSAPADIEFTDMSAMMNASFDLERDGIENLPPSAPSMDELPGLDCSICAELPSGPREACLESLSCVQ